MTGAASFGRSAASSFLLVSKLAPPRAAITSHCRPMFASVLGYDDNVETTPEFLPSTPFFAATMQQHLWILMTFCVSVVAVRQIPALALVISGRPMLSSRPNYYIPPLSVFCWISHYPLLPIGWELAKSFQRLYQYSVSQTKKDSRQNNRLQNLTYIFALSFVQGWIILLHHATISRPLEMELWNLGSKFFVPFLVSCTGVLLVAPQYGRFLVPVLALGVGTRRIHFGNWCGRGLSTFSLAAALGTPGFHVFYRIGYVLTALLPFLGFNSSTNGGHSMGASYLDVFLCLTVLGVKFMERELRLKEATADGLN